MEPILARVIGGAGTGKTSMMLGIMEKALQRPEVAGNPYALGFSSFTRAARTEAANRAAAAWNVRAENLTGDGWFRTAHSVAYKALGVSRGEMLGNSKDDEKWVSEAVGSDVCYRVSEDDEGGIAIYEGDPVAAAALNYWSLSRNLVVPLRDVVEADDSHEAPSAAEVIGRIEMYEAKKRLEGRMDFTDLLSRFVGVTHDPSEGPVFGRPDGMVPDTVVGWIFDEAQDASKLLDMACRRLLTGDAVRWAWAVGDPFQCQPAGTPVLTTGGYKPIESLDPGSDRLIAFNQRDSRFYGFGKLLPFQVASRAVDSSELVEITLADGSKHVCTDNHKWLCRTIRGVWYATYLMRKGDRWRVGTVQMFANWSTKRLKDKNGEFRFGMRMNQEEADEGWILRVFPTDREARMHEQIVSYRFGIPQVTFKPPSGCKNNLDQEFLDSVFMGVCDPGELRRRSDDCLKWHGLNIMFPYRRKADRKKNGRHASRFIEACNLLPHIAVLPRVKEEAFDGMRKGRKFGVYRTAEVNARKRLRARVEWIPVVGVRRMPPGDSVTVYSLNVETHHTYITKDRYITGNCIYGWAGSRSENFMSWEVGKNQKIMPKSYRCAAPILALGERCLKELPDYFDRGIAPADHDGSVEESECFEDDLADINPGEDTLVIARTNRNVAKIAAILDDIGVPFRRIKSKSGAYNRDLGMIALWRLQHNEPISREEWTQAIDMLPSGTSDGKTWLVRGSKSRWNKLLSEHYDRIWPEDLPELGVTDDLRAAIASGAWSGLPDGGTKWVRAAKRWGVEAVANPSVRIGTIHSAKGMEASKVIVLSSLGRKSKEAEETNEARWAEGRRIEYVAVTRAKHKLIVAHDPRERFRMELPI